MAAFTGSSTPPPEKGYKQMERTKDYTSKSLPDFGGRRVFILNGAFYGDAVRMCAMCNMKKADSVDDADIVLFLGGADINPALYKQEPIDGIYFSKERDEREVAAYVKAVQQKKFIYGICRGAQFLAAMNGAELWQDVNHHAGPDHWIVDIETDERVKANSMHHQMIMADSSDELQLIAVCEDSIATRFQCQDLLVDLSREGSNDSPLIETEAGFFPKTGCLFVQGHPEVGSKQYTSWAMQKLYEYLLEWEAANSVDKTEEKPTVGHLAGIVKSMLG